MGSWREATPRETQLALGLDASLIRFARSLATTPRGTRAVLNLGRHGLAGSPFLAKTNLAGTVENDLVIVDPESGGRHRFYSSKAFFKLEDLAADATEKMMMMSLVGEFVAGHLPGNFHANNPAISCERLERTIDGCDPETGASLTARR